MGKFASFSQSLRAAWQVSRITSGCDFRFSFWKKSTGELRDAISAFRATRQPDLTKGIVRFWDAYVEGWRSFDVSTLILS
jgi:hypothetical protein